MNKDQKAAVVAQLTLQFGETTTMFVADYRGLDMPEVTELRNKLRDADASFSVVKNTLARRAAKDAGLEGVAELFVGPTAVAFVQGDAAAVAKVLKDFGKTREGILELRGGLMDGDVVSADQVREIAELPTREVILAMLLNTVDGPARTLVGAINAPARDIVSLLGNWVEKRKENGETEE
ncbi:MAG: ribosomal protein [Thermoleophilia bacterium]|nr:ribosomal protein [Thermoleophilia bacterium]